MKIWYFDAYEVTCCRLQHTSIYTATIQVRGVRKVVGSSQIAPTFEQARTGRMKLIAELIDRKHREIDLAQADIATSLRLLNAAVLDDEGAHVDDEGEA